MGSRLLTVNDVLAGHVTLDVECLDRIYLNGYVPNLQVGGQVVQFLAKRGFPIPSPALIGKIGDRFRESVRTFASSNHIPVVKFGKHDRKITVMTTHLRRQAATGRSGVAAIGVAQEFQRVATCSTTPARSGGAPHFGWGPALRVGSGRPAGDVLLLLCVGRRLRTGVHQDLRLLPVSDQDLAQRSSLGPAAGHDGRSGVHTLVAGLEQFRFLRGSARLAGAL